MSSEAPFPREKARNFTIVQEGSFLELQGPAKAGMEQNADWKSSCIDLAEGSFIEADRELQDC